jgi:hypothetical protein
MSRTLPAGMISTLSGDTITIFYAVELMFDSGAFRMWTGYGDKTINGETYVGGGTLLNIEGITEVADLTASGITLSLVGIPATMLSLALTEPYQGREARVYFGVEGVTDALEVFSGLMDVMTIEHSGESVRVSLSVESKLVTLQRPNVRRYTSANHKLRYPTDTFFDYVTDLQDKEVVWGRKA